MRSAHAPQLRSDVGAPRLVSLREAGVEVFTPTAVPQRLSLALTDPVHGSGLLVQGPSGTSAIVVVWPTDMRGMVLPERMAEARVQSWRLDEPTAARLHAIDLDFPLARHDLLVRLRGTAVVGPCTRSILGELAKAQPALHQRLSREIDRLLQRGNGV